MTPDTFTMDTDIINVTCLPHHEPDLSWVYRDNKGHVHGYIDGELPTLKAKTITRGVLDDGYLDEWEETAYHCRRCKETIKPGTKMVDRGPQFIPGLTRSKATITLPTPLDPGVYDIEQGGKTWPMRVTVCRRTDRGYEHELEGTGPPSQP